MPGRSAANGGLGRDAGPSSSRNSSKGSLVPDAHLIFRALASGKSIACLDADFLSKLRTQYIGPLRTSLQTEFGALEKMPARSANQGCAPHRTRGEARRAQGVRLAPGTRDAFHAQERRYDPDVSDGVRMNIAPVERVGLLAADVIAAKDVEKAIADRAEWRADERRWCREGKLPQPGWWPEPEHRARGA